MNLNLHHPLLEWLLQTTAEYAKTRVQFDRPLGFFQAVKHPLVNVMLEIDKAKSLVYNAACSIDCGEDNAELNARMAKSQASDMAVFSSSRAVQFHGGIGVQSSEIQDCLGDVLLVDRVDP